MEHILSKQGTEDRVIALASRILFKTQQNCSATKQELFAIVHFTQKLKNCLFGQYFLNILSIAQHKQHYMQRKVTTVFTMKQGLPETHQLMRELMDVEQECQKTNYDRSKFGPSYRITEEVLVLNPTVRKGGNLHLSIRDH